jgi:uncharacterized surface protein with fasciclin (FAS1) repeats
MYSATMSVLEKAASLGIVKTFLQAVERSGVKPLLEQQGPFTVFIPDDTAFYRMPVVLVKDMLEDEQQLKALVEYHIVPWRKILSSEAVLMQPYTTMQGNHVFFNKMKRGLFIDDVGIIRPDIECTNGVIHVIDAVLSVGRAHR